MASACSNPQLHAGSLAGTAWAAQIQELCNSFATVLGGRPVTVTLELNGCNILVLGVLCVVCVLLLRKLSQFSQSRRKVFVLDFAVHKPHDRRVGGQKGRGTVAVVGPAQLV